jgi:uncharacterized protein
MTPGSHAAALWAGLHLILLLVLAVLVTRQRRKHGVLIGHGDVPDLERAVRAFGNATEYVPTALAGLAILAIAGAPPLLIHPIGLMLFAGRVLHAVGLTRSRGASWPRNYGVVATWVAYIAAAAGLLFFAVP